MIEFKKEYITQIWKNIKEKLNKKLDTSSSDYIKSITIKGTTLTYTKGDNTTETQTTQDTNTTYDVATQGKNGLMSSNDKTKLDGMYNYISEQITGALERSY